MYYKEEGNSVPYKALNSVEEDYLPDVLKHDGSEKTKYDTSRIFSRNHGSRCFNRFGQPRDFCYGNLEQGGILQNFILENPESSYYIRDDKWSYRIGVSPSLFSISGKIYGQPIFIKNGFYCVYLGGRKLNIEVFGKTLFSGTVAVWRRLLNKEHMFFSDMEFDIVWQPNENPNTELLGGFITDDKKFDYKSVRPDTIAYPGVQGVPLNDGGNFSFNPSGDNGSMDGITNFMKNYYIGGIDVEEEGQSYINSNNTFGGKRPTL